jgi:hypothetical protein
MSPMVRKAPISTGLTLANNICSSLKIEMNKNAFQLWASVATKMPDPAIKTRKTEFADLAHVELSMALPVRGGYCQS